MGLLLSVLVTCVAVVEALAVGRRVGLCCLCYERTNPDLAEYTRNLREELKRAELVEELGEDEEDLKSWSTFSTPGATPQEEFLRTLDGVPVQRPLKRDEGSRKRRSFKSRRSQESKEREELTSATLLARKKALEDELRALTALEEAENATAKCQYDEDYNKITDGDLEETRNGFSDDNKITRNERKIDNHEFMNDTGTSTGEDNSQKKEAFWVKSNF